MDAVRRVKLAADLVAQAVEKLVHLPVAVTVLEIVLVALVAVLQVVQIVAIVVALAAVQLAAALLAKHPARETVQIHVLHNALVIVKEPQWQS